MTPTSKASPNTARRTWLGVAPIARNNPSSRTRWLITMLNVFAMMKIDTNSATIAKPRRTQAKMSMNSLNSAAVSAFSSAVSATLNSSPSTACRSLCTSGTSRDPSIAMRTPPNSVASKRSRVWVCSNASRTAPLVWFSSPNRNVPTSSASLVPSPVGTTKSYVSPTTKPSSAAESTSRTHSPGALGARPSTISELFSCASSIQPKVTTGGPSGSTTEPSSRRGKITPLSDAYDPTAVRTPSIAWACSSWVSVRSESPSEPICRSMP